MPGALSKYANNLAKAWKMAARQDVHPMPDPRPWIFNSPNHREIFGDMKRNAPSAPAPELQQEYTPSDAMWIGTGKVLDGTYNKIMRGLLGSGLLGSALIGATDKQNALTQQLAEARQRQVEDDSLYRRLASTFPTASSAGQMVGDAFVDSFSPTPYGVEGMYGPQPDGSFKWGRRR